MLLFFAPVMARAALAFGPPEFFAIALLGLVALSRISRGPLWKNLLTMGIGLVLTTFGMEPLTGVPRFSFGFVQLFRGLDLIPVIMGLYGVGEVLSVAERTGGLPHIFGVRFRDLFPTRSEWGRSFPAIFRGAGSGFVWGLVPGPAPVIATFASYGLEKRLSKHRDELGQGAIEGVAGPEAANNASSCTSMVPLLSLGIAFTPGSAMLLAALLIQGVTPGPLLVTEHPEIFWGVIASMYIGNIALLVLNFPLVGLWVSILRIPQAMLLSIILLLTLVGAYAINNSTFDLIVLLAMGIVGYLLRKFSFDLAPMAVALVLGPMLEQRLLTSLYMSRGDPFIFFERPISGLFMVALIVLLVAPGTWSFVARRVRAR